MDPVVAAKTPYFVLSDVSIDDIAALTGLKPYELETKLKGSKLFGNAQVYWGEPDRWYTMQVAGNYVFAGELDEIVREAMRRSY